jgi:hypothetical protein
VCGNDSKGLDTVAKPSKPKTSGSKAAKARPGPDTPAEDAVVVEEVIAEPEGVAQAEPYEPQDDEVDAVADETGATVPVESSTASVITTAPPRRTGFLNVVLGGVVAAGLGAGAMYLAQDRAWIDMGSGTDALQATIDAQSGRIASLKAALDNTAEQIEALGTAQPNADAIGQSLDALRASDDGASAEMVALAETLARLRARLEDVETQPIPKAELPAEVVTAYEAQLADVLGAVDARFVEMNGALDAKLAEIEAAQAAAALSEQEALQAANAATARAAMSRVIIALDSGAGFADDLAELAQTVNLELPKALTEESREGVPTLSALMADFPEAARAALRAATAAAASDGSVSPLTAFLRTQLGARSLEPREGDDADAILSRAEGAVGKGDLDTALTEIATLPPVAQDALAGWVARAETRRAALAAAAGVSAQLNSN